MDEPAQVVVPDLVTKECAEEYVITDPEQDDTVTISSTSTADYDPDEAEDIIDKIASCHTSLAKHYEDINKIIPHDQNSTCPVPRKTTSHANGEGRRQDCI